MVVAAMFFIRYSSGYIKNARIGHCKNTTLSRKIWTIRWLQQVAKLVRRDMQGF
jgi:hypothetical protein